MSFSGIIIHELNNRRYSFSAYNLKRVVNILGTKKLIEAMI